MAVNQYQVYELTHSSPELKTVADYISDPSSPAHEYVKDMDSFLEVLHKDGVTTNRQAIENNYKTKADKLYIGKSVDQLLLKVGTVIAIPTQKIDRVGLLTQGIEVVSNDIPAFKARMLAELEASDQYKAVATYKPIQGKLSKGITKEQYPNATVWIWCRALSNTKGNEGQIFNITPFVQKMTTNVSKDGGNFQLTLPPLVCELNEKKIWTIKKKSLTVNSKGEYISEESLFKIANDGSLKRNEFLFHNIISPNDIVWIRFESLQIEGEQRIKDNEDFFITKDRLAGRVYDMIGLVDTNTQTINPSNNDVSIAINGRDLSKLFIEDGTYFYALEMSQGQLNFAGGSTQQNSLMQRVFSDNLLQYFGLYFNNSIEHVLKFVIQQLSTIKIAPDNLFTSYGDRRNKKFNQEKNKINQTQAQSSSLSKLEDKGKQLIKDIRSGVELTEKSANDESLQVGEIWRSLLSFMREIRIQRVRVTSGSITSGWKSFEYSAEDIQENTLPQYFYSNLHITLFYTKAKISKNGEKELFQTVDRFLDLESAQPKNEEIWTEDLAKGIWQIIKLVIDDGVTQRRIVDSSMSSANGSLLNFIRKVCQEPFVEFYMDTYGDMYHLIVRKPPYDERGILSMLEGQVTTDFSQSGGEGKMITSTVIDIEAEDVLHEQLSYDDKGAISWYHLQPQANFIGNASTYSLAYLPAIFFEEYAEIWGSKPMQLTHNYMPRLPLNSQQTSLDVTEKQAFEDLKYMVESNAYLPFTRRGTLKVNGDRRLKYGNIIRYKSTGEIFFIDHVQQEFSIGEDLIERTSTIQVSRGMKETLIYGVATATDSEEIGIFNYFNIVNTNLLVEERNSTETKTEKIQVGVKKSKESSSQIDNLFSGVEKYKGYKYGWGATGRGGRVDCSGFVTRVLQASGINISRTTSEEILKRSNNFRSVATFDINALQEGDVLGIDSGKSSDNRTYGIDHIAIVVRNFNTNQLELAESVGKIGVRSKPLAEIIPHYNNISKRKYLGDFRSIISKEVLTPIYENRSYILNKKDIDREKIFNNFKVFKSCFNFFLRRKMNDDSLSTNYLKEVEIKK